MRLLGGYFVFDSPDAALLVSLLPALVHVRGAERLSVLVRLVGEESSERRSGRDLVLTRLVEVLLIEALRSSSGEDAPPGLLRGLADSQLAPAMREMHGQLARSWTVAELAKTAALSRSAFFDRFMRSVGVPPMEYLLAWRMAVAKDLLRRQAWAWRRLPNASATARPARSARRSAGTWARRPGVTRACRWSKVMVPRQEQLAQSIEPFHLFRYLDEQSYRFNERGLNDAARFVLGLKAILNKRLIYSALTGSELPQTC